MSEKEREKKTSICLFFTVAVTVANCIRWVFVFGSVAATGNSISLNVFLWKHFAKKAEKTNEKKNGGNGKVYHRKYSSFWLFQNGRIESCRVRNTKKILDRPNEISLFLFSFGHFYVPNSGKMSNEKQMGQFNSMISVTQFVRFTSCVSSVCFVAIHCSKEKRSNRFISFLFLLNSILLPKCCVRFVHSSRTYPFLSQ